jgi:hypothetical protein
LPAGPSARSIDAIYWRAEYEGTLRVYDDFAFAANGNIYIAENQLSRLIRIDPRGRITRIAAAADGLQDPSAVAFDPRPSRRTHLYIANSRTSGPIPAWRCSSARRSDTSLTVASALEIDRI